MRQGRVTQSSVRAPMTTTAKRPKAKRLRTNRRKAAAGELEAPERCWMDLSTGRFCTDFELGKPGTQVAIYQRVATGAISLAYPPEA